MATYLERILPSGMAIRVQPLKTKDKLAIDRDVTTKNGDQITTMTETMARCILAHTERQPWLFKKDDDGNSTEAPDTDAMLAAIPAGAWIQDSPVSLRIEGTSVVDILSHLPDFDCAYKTINEASGFGDVKLPLIMAAPPRKVSTG